MNKITQNKMKKYMKQKGLHPFCDDGGCSIVEDVSKEELQKVLDELSKNQTEQLKKINFKIPTATIKQSD